MIVHAALSSSQVLLEVLSTAKLATPAGKGVACRLEAAMLLLGNFLASATHVCVHVLKGWLQIPGMMMVPLSLQIVSNS
jgi:hypothetical protein